MKKVLCLLLAVVCLFAVVSCGDENPAELLFSLTGENAPTEIKTRVEYYVSLDNGRENYSFFGNFDTRMQGDDAIFDYDYQRFADPTKGDSEEMIHRVKGRIVTKDGKVTTEGEEWDPQAATAPNYTVNLGALKNGSYEISEDNRTLTALVTGNRIKRVFGTAVPTSVVELEIKSNGTSVTGMTIHYLTLNTRADVTITTSYSYNAIELFAED